MIRELQNTLSIERKPKLKNPHEQEQNISVFVHLAFNKNAALWRKSRAEGKLVGINDETPYGYGRAETMGCTIQFPTHHNMGYFTKAARLLLRGVFGFDFVHAWLCRNEFRKADIIWTHTESQFLSVAATLLLTKQKTKLLGQVVWLMDRWENLTIFHKWLYRKLLARVDILTFLSIDNYKKAKYLFPRAALEIVPFGIPSETRMMVRTFTGKNLNVLALGNDMHRDWETLVKAVAGEQNITLTILSGSAPRYLSQYGTNIKINVAKNNNELLQALQNADVMCVPLKPNLHASGITVIQEAVLSGIPVIATGTGGLDLYFSENEITYVPVGDILALRSALHGIIQNPAMAKSRAVAAQARMADPECSGAQAYISRHVEISRNLLKA